MIGHEMTTLCGLTMPERSPSFCPLPSGKSVPPKKEKLLGGTPNASGELQPATNRPGIDRRHREDAGILQKFAGGTRLCDYTTEAIIPTIVERLKARTT